MTFVTALALIVGVFVAAPYLAHRLRRRRADDRPFAAAHLVPAAPPRARRRAKLEDHALFATRALAVIALALLGASPLVRCSRLSLQRSSGASVAMAIVVDDSMSMRATDGGRTRFERAREGARELLASAREGDAIAIVLAGSPARVGLAATTDLGAARVALDGLTESDRGTDLEGALTMARALINQLPQVDRRVVVLSDLADGKPNGPPLGEGSAIPVWAPLPDLRTAAVDCGLLTADRSGPRVRVRVACSHGATPSGREITVMLGDAVLAKANAPTTVPGEVTLTIPADKDGALLAKLTGSDAIASDDAAPVVTEAGPGAIAVVGDGPDEVAATGGAPIVEQALAALKLEMAVRPIPVLPDRADDLQTFVGLLIDDPPGFTPEQRKALATFLDEGGLALLALGPHAAAAPLGASFEPIVPHAVAWTSTTVPGADATSGKSVLSEAAASLVDLAPKSRSSLAHDDLSLFEPLMAWKDGAPLVATRTIGRGEAWIVTLPFSVEASDLTLRPGFVSLLDAWVEKARLRASPRRSEVGIPWTFSSSARGLSIDGPAGPLETPRDGEITRVAPALLGLYRVKFDATKHEVRVTAPAEAEIDLRPRAVTSGAATQGLGDTHASVDISWAIALALLGLVAAELALRVRARTGERASEGLPTTPSLG